MKKRFIIFVLIISVLVSCFTACNVGGYKVRYETDGNGTIQGKTVQTLKSGAKTSQVTAVPNEGYRFVKWSDDYTSAKRTDIVDDEDLTITAYFEKSKYPVKYKAENGGKIEGNSSQYVEYGSDASAVTAIANDGYEFLQWSDGITTAQRQDIDIKANKTVTAQFKRNYVKFKLDYNCSESDTGINEVIFYDNDFKKVDFPVPTRDHFTFEGWYIGDKQVADENGKMISGSDILSYEGKEISTKWTANENYTYKILMVYVTELDATIPSIRGNGNFDVYYKMSDFDIEICKRITIQLTNYLNDMLDGLVTFEIDEYFTTIPVGSDSIWKGNVCNGIYANDISEIYNSGKHKDYQSILTVFSMDDYDYEFRTAAGMATNKYGSIYLETVYGSSLVNKEPLEYLLDLDFWRWNDIIETFIHELAHTIEMQIAGSYDYHKIINWAHSQLIYDHILMNKLYYLNQVEIDGQKVGIPIEFWKGELELIPAD